MSTLRIEITPEFERRLQSEAARRGQSVEDAVFAILHERLPQSAGGPGIPENVMMLFRGLPRRTPAALLAAVEAQGVRPVERFEALLGDFWPEEETCDQFIAWLREGRRSGRRDRDR